MLQDEDMKTHVTKVSSRPQAEGAYGSQLSEARHDKEEQASHRGTLNHFQYMNLLP
jgi:hypothetical protein